MDDGTKQYVDMSALIKEYSFNDSGTVAFTEVSGAVSAIVKDGSITEEKLQPNFLADVRVEVAKAESASTSANTSKDTALTNANLSKSYAVGGTGIRQGEDTDNAKYYSEKAKEAAEQAEGGESVTTNDKDNPLTLETSKGRIIDFKADGYTEVADEKIKSLGDLGLVDLGSLDWRYNSAEDGKIFYATDLVGKINGADFVCDIYTNSGYTAYVNMADMSAQLRTNSIVVKNLSYTDATSFKNAMKGVLLAYETEKGFANKYGLPIVSKSKNLLDIPNQTITSRNYIDAKPIELSIGVYTFSYNAELVSGGLSWALKDKDKVNIVSGYASNEVHQVINLTREAKYITIYASGSCNISNVQLEKGNTATEYQPYAKSTSIIPLDEPLFDGDVIYKYADGTGKIVKKMTQVDLGSLVWNNSISSDLFERQLLDIKPNTDNFLSVMYLSLGGKIGAGDVGKITNMSMGLGGTYLRIRNNSYTDPTAFKTAMQGVKLVYELAETQEIPLTAEQILAFEKVKTFEGVTILSVPFDTPIEVTAFANSKDGEVVSAIGDKGIVYSTHERVIGTWLDGRTLYQKTYTLNNVSTNVFDWTTLLTIDEADSIISTDGFIIRPLTQERIKINTTYMSINTLGNIVRYYTENLRSWSSLDWVITVQYTKPTNASRMILEMSTNDIGTELEDM